jgi:hypothetical protein
MRLVRTGREEMDEKRWLKGVTPGRAKREPRNP